MRAAVLVVVCGCSFSLPAATGDAGDDDDPDPLPGSCEAPASFADGLTPTRTIHVSAMASSGGDGSEALPFQRITDAMPLARGTRVLLAAGVHPRQSLNDIEGTAAEPIWIEGPATGDRARFENETFGLQLVRPRYVVVRHIDINTVDSGLVADDGGDQSSSLAHHLEVTDVNVAVAETGFKLSGVSDVSLRRSSATSVAFGVRFVGVHRGLIAEMNVASGSVAGIEVSAGSDEIEISQNRITSTKVPVQLGGASDEPEFRPPLAPSGNYEASRIRLINNVVIDGENLVVCNTCTDSLIAFNYLKSTTGTLNVVNLQGHGSIAGNAFVKAGGLQMANNAIEVDKVPLFSVGINTDGLSCTFSHNLWLNTSTPDLSKPVLPTVETNGIYGIPSGYNDQGKLCAGAAQHTGTNLPDVTRTRDGACRPDPPSIGPSEPTGDC